MDSWILNFRVQSPRISAYWFLLWLLDQRRTRKNKKVQPLKLDKSGRDLFKKKKTLFLTFLLLSFVNFLTLSSEYEQLLALFFMNWERRGGGWVETHYLRKFCIFVHLYCEIEMQKFTSFLPFHFSLFLPLYSLFLMLTLWQEA